MTASTTAAPDFAAARTHMVDSQVRPNKVTDRALIAAMREIPRERFLPPALAPLAYADEDVKLGAGRVMIEPMVLARLLQAAAVQPGEVALVVAAGTGYGAAVLSRCGAKVTALEESAELGALARLALAAVAPGVNLVAGPLAEGWADGAPYGLIIIEGAVAEIPPALIAQLAPGGRLLAIRSRGGSGAGLLGEAILGEAIGGHLAITVLFDCATPPIPSLRPAPGFVF